MHYNWSSHVLCQDLSDLHICRLSYGFEYIGELGAWKGQMVPAKAKLVRGWKKDRDLGVFTCNITSVCPVFIYVRYVSTYRIDCTLIQTQSRDEQPLLFL
jgi:hypothetical protein